MTDAQRLVLAELHGHRVFPGHCELMLATGLKSWKSVDWVLEALVRRGLVSEGYEVTDAGRAALEKRAEFGGGPQR